MSARNSILIKMNLIYLIMIAFGLTLIIKVIYLQFFYDKELIAQATKVTTRYSEIVPNRGDIYSADEKLLATSVPYFEVGIDLNCDGMTKELFNKNIDSLAYCLSLMFPTKSKEQFRQELISNRDNGSRYYRFSNSLDYENFKKMQNFPLLRLDRYKGGFVYVKTTKRERPYGNLCRRTIGVPENDSQRGVGLEAAFETELKGVIGYTVMQKISGNLWMPVTDFNHVEPRDGYDLITTINISIQDIAETALKNRLLYHDAEFGTVVVMEVETGKVRAIVNLTKTGSGNYIEDFNYAVGRASDPGSTFKLATIIAAMEDGYTEPSHIVETGNGICYYHGIKMEDTHEGGYGTISVQKAFEVSSNVGLSKIIHQNYRHQPEKFIDRLYKLNLNKPLNIVIRGEADPVIPYPKDSKWSGISLTQISVGYEVQLTPLQVLTFYNAIANNACLLRPIFAEEFRYRGKTVIKKEPEIINPSICSRQTLLKAKILLEGVVENGTARSIRSNNFKIAGKTGTAQMNYGQSAEKKEYHASFAGYFPAEKPKYSIIVSVYKPQRYGYYGSVVAAPVFKEIAEKIYASDSDFFSEPIDTIQIISQPIAKKSFRRELARVNHWFNLSSNIDRLTNADIVSGHLVDDKVQYNPVHYSNPDIIPNVLNMGLKDALVVLEERGLKVIVHGRGFVRRQIPAAGTDIKRVNQIEIFLEV